MPIINKDLSADEAATRTISKLTTCELDEVMESNATDRKYMICTLLYAKKCVKSVSYFKLTNGQKQKQEATFNRFVLLGVIGKEKVMAIFTYTQLESAELLRYCSALQPGNACALIRPKFDNKYMGSSSTTPIILTSEPLVPLNIKNYPDVSCPRIVSSPDFQHFYIKTKDLKLDNIDAIGNVCNGTFCDGQPKGDCPCLEVDNRKSSWIITADVKCSGLYHSSKIRSKRLITVFAPKCKSADPNKREFDVLDLSDCIENCVEAVNAKNGWAIFGWVKPNESALEFTNYECDLHIIHLQPIEITDVESGKPKLQIFNFPVFILFSLKF